jgi:hypothetical protein
MRRSAIPAAPLATSGIVEEAAVEATGARDRYRCLECGSDCFVHTTCSRCGAWLIHRDVAWARPALLAGPRPSAVPGEWESLAAPVGFFAAVVGFLGAALVQPFQHLTVLAAYLAAFAGMAAGSTATILFGRLLDRRARRTENRALLRDLERVPLTQARAARDGIVRVRGRIRPLDATTQRGEEVACVAGDTQQGTRFQVVDASGCVLVERSHLEVWVGAERASELDRPVRLRAGDLVDAVAVGRWEILPELDRGYRTSRSVYRLIGRPGTPIHLRLADAAALARERAAA